MSLTHTFNTCNMRNGGKMLPKVSRDGAPRTPWEQAGNSAPGAPAAAASRRLIGGFGFAQQNLQHWQCLVGTGRVWTQDSQGLRKLLPPNPAHKKLFMFSVCQKSPLCVVETCLSWTPNNKHMATSSPDDKSFCWWARNGSRGPVLCKPLAAWSLADYSERVLWKEVCFLTILLLHTWATCKHHYYGHVSFGQAAFISSPKCYRSQGSQCISIQIIKLSVKSIKKIYKIL